VDNRSRIEALETVIAEQQRVLADARAEIERLKGNARPASYGEPEAARLTRRAWLRRAAQVSGVAAAAVVVTDFSRAAPAAAADGGSVVAGEETKAESSTVLFGDGSNYDQGLLAVTDTALADYSAGFPAQAAVTGYAGTGVTGLVGVAGYGDGAGIYGQTDHANAYGVHGVTSAVGSYGVRGEATGNDGCGVYGTGSGESNAIGVYGNTGQTAGGAGVVGYGEYGMIATGTDVGLEADGANYAVRATCSGIGATAVSATLSDSRNKSAAVSATTSGAGAAVSAASTSGVGVSGIGVRGASFAGTAAQWHARPGSRSTHPSSGEAGDFYVDSAHRLWFCRGRTEWVRLA